MNQRFYVAAITTLFSASAAHAQVTAGSTYQLKRGTECIASGAAGSAVALSPCVADADGTAQAFKLFAGTGGTFSVQSVTNGEMFDIDGAETAAGTAVITWPGNGADNQRFAINSRSAGVYELRPQHTTGQCISAEADNTVKLRACNSGTVEQSWEMVEVEVEVSENSLDCTSDELFDPNFLENTQGGPTGANVVLMTGGYMMLIWSVDSGKTPGILEFFDISDPRHPVSVKRINDAHTQRFREAHSLPSALVGGKEYVAIQTVDGIQFWDLTDPLNAHFASEIDLEGISGGDYDNVAWQAEWHGRTLYVAGANQGLYVIDAANPLEPVLLNKVSNGSMGGFRIGPLLARGSYLVVGSMESDVAYSVLDITSPRTPALLSTFREGIKLYSMTASGDRIYGAGREGDFTIHSFEDPTEIKRVSVTRIGQDSLYVATQDHFVFSGRQDNFVKLDVSDEQNVRQVGEGTVGREHSDHGQVTPMGNWIFIGNDHGTGCAFFCHALTDDLPLGVQKVFPSDGDTQQDPNSTVTIVFSDYVDTRTVNSSTVSIRPGGGEPLEGIYTYNFNTLHFSPNEPFEANTTYEIVMSDDGVKDVSGNPLAEEKIVRFSTGDMVVIPPPPPPMEEPDAGVAGGAGGDVGGAGGMMATAGSGGVSGTGAAGAGGMTNTGGTAGTVAGAGASMAPASSASDGGCHIGPRSETARWTSFVPSVIAALWLMRRRARARSGA